MAPSVLQRAKNRVVFDGPRERTLPLGIGRGLVMSLDLRHRTKLFLGLFEIELNRWLKRFCKPGMKCFDVGGQNGYDALVMAKLTGDRVVSFECDPGEVRGMQVSLDANPDLRDLVTAKTAFVGAESDREGRLALDDFANSPEGFLPDVIKIDIEGGELDALKGAEAILRDRRPHLIIEVHSVELERSCRELLESHGYQPIVVSARRWLKDNRPIAHNRWLVCEGRAAGQVA